MISCTKRTINIPSSLSSSSSSSSYLISQVNHLTIVVQQVFEHIFSSSFFLLLLPHIYFIPHLQTTFNMQLTLALRQALLATIVLSPGFITGLALPWDVNSGLALRDTLLSELAHIPHLHKIRQGDEFASGMCMIQKEKRKEKNIVRVSRLLILEMYIYIYI